MFLRKQRPVLERSLVPGLLPIRLSGIGASNLSRGPAIQGDLFDMERQKKQSSLDRTVDAIRDQFGAGAIQRGSLQGRIKSAGEGLAQD